MTSHNRLPSENQVIDLQRLSAQSDQKAFEEIYRLFSERIYQVAYAYTESTVLSEEILQDIFVQVWMKRTELPAIIDFEAWLFTLTRNRSFNVLRGLARAGNRERDMFSFLPGSNEAPDNRVMSSDMEKLLRSAMSLLTPAQRKAFELFKLQGLNREQTAVAMNISPNTAKVHLLQALRTIRAYLMAKGVFFFCVLLLIPFS